MFISRAHLNCGLCSFMYAAMPVGTILNQHENAFAKLFLNNLKTNLTKRKKRTPGWGEGEH